MERFFQILAVILGGVAAYFLWQDNADRAFAAAVFGAISFFLSVRAQVKGRLREREAEREEAEKNIEEDKEKAEIEDAEISDSEPPQLNEIPVKEQIYRRQRTTDNKRI